MKCSYCNQPADLVAGDRLYPHRPDLHGKMFWHCSACEASVGCHDGTSEPLGTMANPRLRDLRNKAHRLFDALWQNGAMTRRVAYRWLAEKMAIGEAECHISWFDDEKCLRVISVCDNVKCSVCGQRGKIDNLPCKKLLCFKLVPKLVPKGA